MGMQYVFIKTLALIPGPIIFGHLLDLCCRLWQDICGQQGRCFVYDVDLVGRNICVFGVVATGKEHTVVYLFYFYLYAFGASMWSNRPRIPSFLDWPLNSDI